MKRHACLFLLALLPSTASIACVGWHSGEAGGFPAIAPATAPTSSRTLSLVVDCGGVDQAHRSDLWPWFTNDIDTWIIAGVKDEGHFRLGVHAADYILELHIADEYAPTKSQTKLIETSALTAGIFPYWETHPITVDAIVKSPDGSILAHRTVHEDFTILMETLGLAALPFGAKNPGRDSTFLWYELGTDAARWSAFEVNRHEHPTGAFAAD